MEKKNTAKILTVDETNELIAKWVRVLDSGKATSQDIKTAEGVKNLIGVQIRKENVQNQYLARIKSKAPITSLEARGAGKKAV
ncbi:MAG: hypothetical protein LBB72_01540 [Spirochaetaceae bacterium]|jgi:tRNA U34 2-thiouridine synthase MnmA/TrmU|nr:hypothetical protein [Spirochaetaceae bacterium]